MTWYVPAEPRFSQPGVVEALLVAILLLVMPIGYTVWRVLERRGHWAGASDPTVSFAHPMRARDRLAWQCYLILVAAVTIKLLFDVMAHDAESSARLLALTLFCAGMSCMTIAPVYPLVGPLAYCVLSYVLPRGHAATLVTMDLGVLSYLTFLSAAALGVRWARQRSAPSPAKGPLVWAIALLACWLAVVVLACVVAGRPLPQVVYRSTRFVQCFALFFVVANSGVGLADMRLLALTLGSLLTVKAFVATDVHLDQNLAMLLAISLPLVLVVARTAANRLTQCGFVLMVLYLFGLLVAIANRGAAVGVLLAVVAMWVASRHRLRNLLFATPLLVVGLAMFPMTEIGQRMTAAYQDGRFQGSAAERLQIWTAGVEMARDHALFGVGPDNFPLAVSSYDSTLQIAAHNSFIEMMAETGYVGLLAYVTVILTASWVCLVQARHRLDWRGVIAVGILGCLWAHVGAGTFLFSHSLVLSYVLLGVGVAITAAPVTHVYRARWRPNAERSAILPTLFSGMPVSWNEAIKVDRRRPFQYRLPRQAHPYAALLVVYSVFVILGSLSPFHFAAANLVDALQAFRVGLFRPVDFLDRADWLSNIALFIPWGFLAAAALASITTVRLPLLAQGLFVIAAAGCYSLCIEFMQLWFPPRVISPNDVVGEMVGAAIGVSVWILVGTSLSQVVASWMAERRPLTRLDYLGLGYAVLLVVCALWPFDLTINPVDVARRLREQRLGITALDAGAIGTLLWHLMLLLPIGIWLRTVAIRRAVGARDSRRVFFAGTLFVVALACCRLLVFSQTVSVVDVLGGMVGIALGAMWRRP